MTVKQFIEIIKDTNFVSRRVSETFSGKLVAVTNLESIKLKDFKNHVLTYLADKSIIKIERNYELFKSYDNLNDLLDDEDVLNMEIFKIKTIQLNNEYYHTSNGNDYISNNSQIEIIVK